MPTARRHTKNALILTFAVASGQSVTEGEAVVLASDSTVQDAGGASDLAVGIARQSGTGANSDRVEVTMFGYAVERVLVGTGGATRGTKAKLVADGFTDATTHDSDGTGNESTYGVFMETGVVGDYVGLLLSGAGNRGV